MRLVPRLSLAAACCTILAAGACSDSTSPNSSQSPAKVAAHFDSIYAAAIAQSSSAEDGFAGRALLATYLEISAGLGASPANLTVETASGTEHWKGYEIEDVSLSGGTPTDTLYLLVAYREAAAHTVLYAYFDPDGQLADGQAGIFTNDTLSIGATDGSGATSRSSLGNTCTSFPSSLTNPNLATLGTFTCNLASFQTSVSLTMPATGGVDAALTSVSLSAQTVNGVRVAQEEGTATVRRVRDLLHMHVGGKRF